MKTAIGPWARTAYMLLVLISFRYNINTTVKRCNGYDFGHYELHYIDRIQHRIQELFNIVFWPRYKNVSTICHKEDFVSVGIGPLTSDHRFVNISDSPSANLSPDLSFIAERMKLKYPLLPISTHFEYQILNDFLSNNKPTPRALETNEKSNEIDMAEKTLAQMFRMY